MPQVLQIRSDVLVAKSEKKVPSEHVEDTRDAHSERIVPDDVETEETFAKKLTPHSMQTRLDVSVAASE